MEGRHFAEAAQNYGMYIVDSGNGAGGGPTFAFAIENYAAHVDLGAEAGPNGFTYAPGVADLVGFQADVRHVLKLVKAVIGNS